MFLDKCVAFGTDSLWDIPILMTRAAIVGLSDLKRTSISFQSAHDLGTLVAARANHFGGKFVKLIVFDHGVETTKGHVKLGFCLGSDLIVQSKSAVQNVTDLKLDEMKDATEIAADLGKLTAVLSDNAVVIFANCWAANFPQLQADMAKAIKRPVIAGTGQTSILGGNDGTIIQINPDGTKVTKEKMEF